MSVVLIISRINECQIANAALAKLLSSEQEQNRDLAQVVAKMSSEVNLGTYIITEDYGEEISSSDFKHASVISDAAAWKQQVNIDYGPVVVILAKGIIKRIATPFDFTEESNLDSLRKLITDMHVPRKREQAFK